MSARRAPTVNVDDADNLRRFIEQMGRPVNAQATVAQAEAEAEAEAEPGIQQHAAGDSTDTDPDRDLYEVSTNSSPATAPEQHAVVAHDMQSPMARGVVAPPPTPNMSVATDDVEKSNHDHADAVQAISGLSLGDSKYAKVTPLAPLHYSRPSGVLVSHSPLGSKLSPEQRRDRDMSFARMSFVTSDQPAIRFPKLTSKAASLTNSGSKTFPEASLSYENSSISFDLDGTPIDNSEAFKEKSSGIDIPTFKEVVEKTSEVDIPTITLADDIQEAEEENSEATVHVTTHRSTFMDKWIQSSKSKPIAKPATFKAIEDVKMTVASQETLKVPVEPLSATPPPHLRSLKKPATVEENHKASVEGPSVIPPHLRATAKPFVPTAAESNIKMETKPVDKPEVVSGQTTAPMTPPFTPRALVPADKVGNVHLAEVQRAAIPQVRREYSPARGTLAAKAAKTEDTLKHAVMFQAWPKAQGRDQAVARARKVTLVGLPPAASLQFVTSLVHGGPLEEIRLTGPTTAFVLFLDPNDASDFYKGTANGIDCQKEGVKYIVLTEMNAGEVDVVGGKLRMWIDSGMTRCVRVIGNVGVEWTYGRLYDLAEAKNRKVETIELGVNPGGLRSIIFRFCKIDNAVEFKGALSRSDDWEHCNIHYSPDPCADSAAAAAAA